MVNDGLRSEQLKVKDTDFTDLETGSGIATNVAVAVTFKNTFDSAPRVLLTPAASGTHATEAYVAGVSAGSFTFVGQSGLEYTYLAREAS